MIQNNLLDLLWEHEDPKQNNVNISVPPSMGSMGKYNDSQPCGF